MERINRDLPGQLTNTRRVILWGSGQFAMKLLALPCLARTEVRALVDNNPILRGKTIAGAPIIGPEKLGPQEISGTGEPIIIATFLHPDEFSAQILRLGLSNPLLSLLQHSNPHPP